MREAGGDVMIRLRGVRKAFGAKVVLDGIDLEVEAGSSTVVIGGSGTGKSVLLKHVVGLLRPDEGTIEIGGMDLADLKGGDVPRFRQRFGMAFQEGALFDSMTVSENVAFPLTRLGGATREEIRDRVAECLRLVRLDDAAGKMPAELSGGMRRRVGIARAIVHEPEILLLDEPTTGLDPVTKETIDELVLELQETLGSTLLTISHDMGSVFRIADRIAMLYGGKIIAHEPPEDLKRNTNPHVVEFLRRDLAMWAGGDR